MKTAKKIVISVLICLLLGLNIYLYYYRARFLSVTYTSDSYTETAELLKNPYCGFYRIYAYRLNGSVPDTNSIAATAATSPGRLALLEFNLRDWTNAEMSEAALSQLDTVLSCWANSDKQLIIRFLYDWDGNAAATEPKDLSMIQTHMKQTAKIYNSYAPHIYIIQGIYTGNYGELHHSYHQSEEDIASLAKTLYDVSDSSIFLSVRTPNQWRTIEEKTSGRLNERLGLFNDGMLASASDVGTYGESERENEITFQDALCQTVPNGGEVIIPNPYNDFENAISDFARMHISYLNMDYDTDVLNKWKNATYIGEGIFHGCDGYSYVENHLGYRFVIRSSELSFEPMREDTATLSVDIENVGFSANYIPFTHTITLLAQTDGQRYTFDTMNCPILAGGKKNTISYCIPVRDIASDTYDVYMHTKDSVLSETIRYGNNLAFTSDGYHIGSITIEK